MQSQSARAGVMRMWRRRMSEDDDDEKEGNKYDEIEKKKGEDVTLFLLCFFIIMA